MNTKVLPAAAVALWITALGAAPSYAAPQGGRVVVDVDLANIRLEASARSRVVAVVGTGAVLELVGHESQQWLRVRSQEVGVEGYLNARNAKLVVEGQTAEPIPGKTMIVRVPLPETALPAATPSATSSTDAGPTADEQLADLWPANRTHDIAGLPRVRLRTAAHLYADPSATEAVVGLLQPGWEMVLRENGPDDWVRVEFVPFAAGGWLHAGEIENLTSPTGIVQVGGQPVTDPQTFATLAADVKTAVQLAVREAAESRDGIWRQMLQEEQKRSAEATDALKAIQTVLTQKKQEEQSQVVKELTQRPDFETAIFLDGGLGNAGDDTGLSLRGGAAFAWRQSRGLIFQAAGMVNRSGSLREFGESVGIGYERGRLGAFGFVDIMQHSITPYARTSHVQLRPTVRYRTEDFSVTGYYAAPLTSDKLSHEETTIRYRAAEDGIHEVTDTFKIFDLALAHGGSALRWPVSDRLTLSAKGDIAEGGAYRIGAGGELAIVSNWLVTVAAERRHYGDYPLLANAGFNAGWDVRFGVMFREGGVKLSPLVAADGGIVQPKARGEMRRLLVPIDYPLVVQRTERSTDDLVVADLLSATATADPRSGQNPLTVNLEARASGGRSPYRYQWSFGDSAAKTASTGRTVSHTYTTRGRFTATVIVRDALDGIATASADVDVFDTSLTAQCSASPTKGEPPLTVQFSAIAAGGIGEYQYLWQFDDGATSTVRNPEHVYEDEGTYRAVLRVTSGAEAVSCSETIVVAKDGGGGDELTLRCNATPTEGTAPLRVEFSAEATGGERPYTYEWRFDDGATALGARAAHTYQSPGSYTAVVTVTDALDKSVSCSRQITVTDNGEPDPVEVQCTASPRTIIAPDSVSFAATATGGVPPYTYRWAFNDPAHGTSDEQNPRYVYNCDPGTYPAQVTARDKDGREATCEAEVRVNSPNVSLTCSATPATGNAPLTVQFDVAVGGQYNEQDITYFWDFDDGTISDAKNPAHTYSAPGEYFTVVIVTTGCVSKECEAKVVVN